MKTKIFLFLAVYLMAQVGIAQAVPWVGTIKIGGTDYTNSILFDWDKSNSTVTTNTLTLNGAQLTALIDTASNSSGPFTNATLTLNLDKSTTVADSFFDIFFDLVQVVHGTLSESASIIDTTTSYYELVGTVISFTNTNFSPAILGFEMSGGLSSTGDKIADGYSNFTPVPEPSTIVLAGMGLIGLIAVARRKTL